MLMHRILIETKTGRIFQALLTVFAVLSFAGPVAASEADVQRMATLRTAYQAGQFNSKHAQVPVLRKLLRSDNESIRCQAAWLYGKLLLDGGNDAEAVRHWRAAIVNAQPEHGVCWEELRLALGRWEWQQGQHLSVLELLEPIVVLKPEAELAIEAAYWCGRSHLAQANRPRAISAFTWARHHGSSRVSEPASVYPFW